MPTGEGAAVRLDRAEAEEYFDADWYRRAHPDVLGADAWTHFATHGEAERRSPGPGFDAEFYARTYLPLEAGGALHHFLTEGRRSGHLPVPAPQTRGESREAMERLLAPLDHPFLLVGNDAQRAGAPLLLLELARHLRRRGWSPVFVLRRGGPLLAQHRAVGPTLLVDEGHDVAGLGTALEPETPVLGSTGWAAPLLERLHPPGPAVLAVHEMPAYLEENGLLDAVARARTVVTAMPTVTERLLERLPPASVVHTVLPGLLHVTGGPEATARVARLLEERFGADRVVFVGAGFADHRKGFDRFLDLATDLHRREPRSAFVWLGELGGWARERAARARTDGLPLLLPGFRTDAAGWYANADGYLLTSRQDPGPTTVVDAARCGVPFVAVPGDLGLRSLGAHLDGVGWFADDEAEAADRALALAGSETPATRAARARYVESFARFGRYVDDLLELLRGDGLVDEPWTGAGVADAAG